MQTLITGATVYPITSKKLEVADVLLFDGQIAAIEPFIEPTDQMEVIDGFGYHLLPGFIDAHTHLGLYDEGTGWAGNDANETIEPLTPHIRAMDGVNPLDLGFYDAVRFGITAVNIMPGSANIIGGTTSVIKTHGKNIEQMFVKKVSGLKMALGENPKRIHSGNDHSITRMGIMGMIRETFYHAKRSKDKENPRIRPLLAAIDREIPVRIHAHRADDILSAVRFAEEFNLDLRIEHCTEGHLIADELTGKNLKVTVGPTLTRRSKIELLNKTWKTYAILDQAGVEVSITTDHPYTPIHYLNICAALAVRDGLSEEQALKGITIYPAQNLGVSHKIGSIEVGKDADVVLWNEHPFHYLATPVLTFINGQIIYKKS